MGSALIGLISVKKTGHMQILNIFPVVPSSTSFTYSLSVSLSVCAGACAVCVCVCVCTHTCLGVCSLLLAQTVVVVCFWTFLHLLLAVAKKGQMVAASGERNEPHSIYVAPSLSFCFVFPSLRLYNTPGGKILEMFFVVTKWRYVFYFNLMVGTLTLTSWTWLSNPTFRSLRYAFILFICNSWEIT